jgi:hypothetical protein
MADRHAGIHRFELFSYWRADCPEREIFVFFPQAFNFEKLLKNFVHCTLFLLLPNEFKY